MCSVSLYRLQNKSWNEKNHQNIRTIEEQMRNTFRHNLSNFIEIVLARNFATSKWPLISHWRIVRSACIEQFMTLSKNVYLHQAQLVTLQAEKWLPSMIFPLVANVRLWRKDWLTAATRKNKGHQSKGVWDSLFGAVVFCAWNYRHGGRRDIRLRPNSRGDIEKICQISRGATELVLQPCDPFTPSKPENIPNRGPFSSEKSHRSIFVR